MFYTPPASANVEPYQTLNYEINESLGVLSKLLKIDTSSGTITTNILTIGPGLYQGAVIIPSGTLVIGLMVSCPISNSSLAPLIASIRNLGGGGFSFTVQDPVSGNYLSDWQFMQLTIYVKLT